MEAEDGSSLLTETLAPLLGVVTATLIFLAPLSDVRQIALTGELADFNPIPLGFIVTNALSWILYSLLVRNFYIFWSNVSGFCLGLYYIVSALGARDVPASARSLVTTVFTAGPFLILIGFHVAFLVVNPDDPDKARSLGGWICVAALLAFYTSPLSTLHHVLLTRDASSFSYPLSLACVLNGALWTVYGLVIGDGFVWAPNAVGAVVGVVQVGLLVVFGRGEGAGGVGRGKVQGYRAVESDEDGVEEG
ncbi:hypothetical protein M427DRAFT_54321 [Gonapodya prolifera JEL478]|uniref:Sugar transporter SWEET1 n=1 Tax=Gonapodya prolifera (strain JEL478) TaxID=1344416 RepID=A0A139ALS5_GONPJ|nr:hypothetical protein M427DRAFT_54321 [Gonapodya prolifera JEL478]|eukprot:KXS17721.1 hypothetical protein M427DRAFT_54321 [Gonapodya prolifera JEL478]